MASVVILSRISKWGVSNDAKLVEQIFREANALKWLPIRSVDHMDPYTFQNPKAVDIQIHLEIPCQQAWIWGKINIVVVNPEWWVKGAWDWALQKADWLIFKSPHVASLPTFSSVDAKRILVIPWRPTSPPSLPSSTSESELRDEVVYFLGGSKHKMAAAATVIRAWKPHWPPLRVFTASTDALPYPHPKNVTYSTEFLSAEKKWEIQKTAKFHCVASVAEGFGYTMAECAQAGQLPLWVDLPVQTGTWGDVLGTVGRIASSQEESTLELGGGRFAEEPVSINTEAVISAADALFRLKPAEANRIRRVLQEKAGAVTQQFRSGWKQLAGKMLGILKTKQQPFVSRRIPEDELPHVAVVTLTHNRPKWFVNMTRNILLADYPREKLIWIVVDDSDAGGRVDEQIMRFQEKMPQVQLQYVSLTKRLSVGEKRNRGIRAGAARGAEVFVMMDDDDHYPKSSIQARVSYLKLLGSACVYCATIPMYDCQRYISAMNTPPLDLGPAERVSEATLAFTRKFWEERPFAAISMAEGEAFLAGRESAATEIPPDGIIVSFIHGGNASSRRVPEKQEPNGCHFGFDDDYFTYVSERGYDRPPAAAP